MVSNRVVLSKSDLEIPLAKVQPVVVKKVDYFEIWKLAGVISDKNCQQYFQELILVAEVQKKDRRVTADLLEIYLEGSFLEEEEREFARWITFLL